VRKANEMIKGGTDVEVKNIDIEERDDHSTDDDIAISVTDNWVKWSHQLYQKAEEVAFSFKNGITVNTFYNPQAANVLRRLIVSLPIWTGIMCPHFKQNFVITTSSIVEAEFAHLKNREFKSELPMRVDKFVLKHIDYIKGKLMI